MLHSPKTGVAITKKLLKPVEQKEKPLKLSINFVHLFLGFSALKIQLKYLRMVVLNFMHLGSEPILRRILLCNGEYIKLVKNTVSSSNPGNFVFSNQTKTSSKYE